LQQPAGRAIGDGGVASGGLRDMIPCIARTCVAVGVDGIFMASSATFQNFVHIVLLKNGQHVSSNASQMIY